MVIYSKCIVCLNRANKVLISPSRCVRGQLLVLRNIKNLRKNDLWHIPLAVAHPHLFEGGATSVATFFVAYFFNKTRVHIVIWFIFCESGYLRVCYGSTLYNNIYKPIPIGQTQQLSGQESNSRTFLLERQRARVHLFFFVFCLRVCAFATSLLPAICCWCWCCWCVFLCPVLMFLLLLVFNLTPVASRVL